MILWCIKKKFRHWLLLGCALVSLGKSMETVLLFSSRTESSAGECYVARAEEKKNEQDETEEREQNLG